MSDFGSSVADKKRIVIKNPDGSYSHCMNIIKILQVINQEKEILQ